MPIPDELSLFVVRLETIGAPYMVTGATAAILYGQPRGGKPGVSSHSLIFQPKCDPAPPPQFVR